MKSVVRYYILLGTIFFCTVCTNARIVKDTPTAIGIVLTFIMFLRFNLQGNAFAIIGSWGKRYSLDIYLWHPMVMTVYSVFKHHIPFTSHIDTVIIALLTFALCVFLKPSAMPDKCHKYLKNVVLGTR